MLGAVELAREDLVGDGCASMGVLKELKTSSIHSLIHPVPSFLSPLPLLHNPNYPLNLLRRLIHRLLRPGPQPQAPTVSASAPELLLHHLGAEGRAAQTRSILQVIWRNFFFEFREEAVPAACGRVALAGEGLLLLGRARHC